MTQPQILAGVVLAAGQGTRMKSALPKVLHPLGGQPLVAYSVATLTEAAGSPPVLVVGPESDDVRAALGARARYAVQPRPLGTADAVRAASSALQGAATD